MGIARFLPPRLTERGENLEQPPAIFGPDLFVDVPLVLGGEHLGIPKRDLPAGGKMQRVRPPIGRRTNTFYQIASFESVQQEHQPRLLDAETLGNGYLGRAGVRADHRHYRILHRADIYCCKRFDEVVKNPHLEASYRIADVAD